MATRPTPSPSPIQSPSTKSSPPLKKSGDYSGALWEIGDFLFAARSIAKIAHGKGTWGDAFSAGVSAAALFISPLKLGKLAEPALKAVVAESEKMLTTEVVSTVGKRQLEKNIKNVNDLLSTQPEFRAQRATQLDQLAPDAVAPITDNTSTAIARQGGVVKGVEVERLGAKEHPMPPENVVSPREPYKMESAPTSATETEPADFSSWLTDAEHDSKRKAYVKIKRELLDGSVKRSNLTADQQRIVEVFDHYRNPKNKIKVTLTDSDGNKYPGYMYSPFRESVKQPLGAGGAEREFDFATFYEEKVAELESIIEARKYHETRLSRLQNELADPEIKEGLSNVIKKEMQQSVKALEKLLPQDKELMNWLRGTWDSYFKKATADKGLTDISDVTLSDSHLSKEIIEQIKGKTPAAPESMLASGKPASKKFTKEGARVRKNVEEEDAEALAERNATWEDRDILTAEEAKNANISGLTNDRGEYLQEGSRRMADSTSDSGGYIEDIAPKKNSGSDAIDFESGIDSSSKFDIGAEGGKYGIGKKPNLSRTTLSERRKDIKFAKRRIAQLEAEVARGVKVNEAKRYVPADELKKAKVELSRLVKELKEASPRNPNAVVAEDQRVHLEAFKKHLNPTVDVPGHKGTAPKTVSLLDRIYRVEGLLSKEGRLNLRKKMVDESGKTEKQFFAQIAKYEKELETLKARAKNQDKAFSDTLGKLDENSMKKVSSWVESLSEAALKRTALKHETFYAQKAYLNKLAMSTTDVATRKRILGVIDNLETESRMGLRSTLAKRSTLQQQNLDKATGVTKSSTTRAIEKKVKLLEAEKIMAKGGPVVHSGGAKGADTAWAEAADAVGIPTKGHSFEGHEKLPPNSAGFTGIRPALEERIIYTKEEIDKAKPFIQRAAKNLGTNPSSNNLVLRNYYQVKDSDAVMAIVKKLSDDKKTTSSGTRWGMQMGIDKGVPVYVFDQSVAKWFKWNGTIFEETGLPPKFKSFAGIGTRDLEPSGKKAIIEYMEHVSGKKAIAKAEEAVTSFRDKYRFLSNMSPSSITIEGIRYPTVEHAFQAAKTTDQELRKKIARAANPAEAKRMGRELTLRNDWNDIRVKAMEYILRKKFEDPKLLKQLLETGERELIEGNTWGDKFWGQVDGEGANNLGKLLMKIRKELMEGK